MGYLSKKGAKRRNWKDRWFILKKDSIAYYANPTVGPSHRWHTVRRRAITCHAFPKRFLTKGLSHCHHRTPHPREPFPCEDVRCSIPAGNPFASTSPISIVTTTSWPRTSRSKRNGWKLSWPASKNSRRRYVVRLDNRMGHFRLTLIIHFQEEEMPEALAAAEKQRSAYQAGAEKEGTLMYEESPGRWLSNWLSLKEGRLYLFGSRTVRCCSILSWSCAFPDSVPLEKRMPGHMVSLNWKAARSRWKLARIRKRRKKHNLYLSS